ncbi:queuine tRNA-ribosyltransferase accessory subunit 2 [Centruroides vittatus]|uniref:queuine tRNA-ribosyltransferase accessory subunit 2 n=1 Tax=Centruroides vittatus TaxID=120091 RepID=UPI0035104A6E
MDFNVEKAGTEQSRLGLVNGMTEDMNFRTPFCFLYTKSGSVPHITREVFQFLSEKHIPLLLPLPSIVELKNAVMNYGQSLCKFVGLNEYPNFISVQDPAVATPSGYNNKTGVSVWKHSGREHLDPNAFMEIQEVFTPHCYQALCDSDTPQNCSKKRMHHSVQRSLSFLDSCLERHLSSQKLKNSSIFGTVQGGYDIKAREFSARETALRPVTGFIIDGFHQNGEEAEKINLAEVKPILQSTVSLLPKTKLKMMFGSFKPSIVVEFVLCGIDVFDASYAYLSTERGKALVFPLTWKDSKSTSPEIDLTCDEYKDNFNSLLTDCKCYTCRNFTCAYVHHLLSTSELLASVLLMLHNLHHYLEFFSSIRNAIEQEKLIDYKNVLLNAYI